jgi:uncharacterized protein (DUF58 family)
MSSYPLASRGSGTAVFRRPSRLAWRAFFVAAGALGAALLLAFYSRVAAENAQIWLAALSAMAALVIAGWVAVTIVPALARRTVLRRLVIPLDYRMTREGIIYLGGILVVTLAALNTGNNLLFLILATLLAGILVSGVVSHIVLSGVDLRLDLPEHIFAGQPVRALARLANHKRTLPSFSLRLCGTASGPKRSKPAAAEILAQPVYFPYLAARQTSGQSVDLVFPRRGRYRQEILGVQTRFPFGFVEKTRVVESKLEALVYPAVEPTDEFYEVLPLVSGEMESFMRGRGHDLYSIRPYQTFDSARHVDWKASAKMNSLQVREFTREDERRVLLVLDPYGPAAANAEDPVFERGVSLCASLAWHFYEIDSVLGFVTAGFETPVAPAGEVIYDVLRQLALAAPLTAEPGRSFLGSLAESSLLFKIVLTRQPRGSVPTSLWSSSYVIFLES